MQNLQELQSIMRQDRENDDAFAESHEEYFQRLQDMHPDNSTVLPRSPCIRVKKTGAIWPWSPDFAARPDLCECCNEDGSPWQDTVVPMRKAEPVINSKIIRKPVRDEHATAVGMASDVLGVTKEFSQDFSVANGAKEAMPLPEQSEAIDVSKVIDAVFDSNVK